MKKIIVFLISSFFLLMGVSAEEKPLVNVYVFEAGGCPACERVLENLKSLESYNKKFQIVEKELYVDHINWQTGRDFVLGVKVVNAFNNNNGFEKASYNKTPLVVISDTFAANTTVGNFEEIIDEAYENGTNDVVECISEHKDNCLAGYVDATYESNAQKVLASRNGNTTTKTTQKESNTGEDTSIMIMTISILIILLVFISLIAVNKNLSEKIQKEEKRKAELAKEEAKKKVPPKKATTKKATTKKTSTKKSATKKSTSVKKEK